VAEVSSLAVEATPEAGGVSMVAVVVASCSVAALLVVLVAAAKTVVDKRRETSAPHTDTMPMAYQNQLF